MVHIRGALLSNHTVPRDFRRTRKAVKTITRWRLPFELRDTVRDALLCSALGKHVPHKHWFMADERGVGSVVVTTIIMWQSSGRRRVPYAATTTKVPATVPSIEEAKASKVDHDRLCRQKQVPTFLAQRNKGTVLKTSTRSFVQ